mgnify:CR=1 FL=1
MVIVVPQTSGSINKQILSSQTKRRCTVQAARVTSDFTKHYDEQLVDDKKMMKNVCCCQIVISAENIDQSIGLFTQEKTNRLVYPE